MHRCRRDVTANLHPKYIKNKIDKLKEKKVSGNKKKCVPFVEKKPKNIPFVTTNDSQFRVFVAKE